MKPSRSIGVTLLLLCLVFSPISALTGQEAQELTEIFQSLSRSYESTRSELNSLSLSIGDLRGRQLSLEETTRSLGEQSKSLATLPDEVERISNEQQSILTKYESVSLSLETIQEDLRISSEDFKRNHKALEKVSSDLESSLKSIHRKQKVTEIALWAGLAYIVARELVYPLIKNALE